MREAPGGMLAPMRALLLVVAIAACGRSSSPPDPFAVTCAHYAKLFASCASEQKAGLEDTADNLCHKGLSGKYEETFGARYRAMIACSRTAETCDALRACEAN